MEKNKIIGEKIHSIRENKEITIEDLAERSGLSVEQIKVIEENAELPALSQLIKIARVLGVRLGTFTDDQDNLGPVICRNNQSSKAVSFSTNNSDARKHMDYFSLAQSKVNRHMEPFIIDIAPDTESKHLMGTHEGEEFIYVMDGEIEINYGNKTYQLSTGDSIYYDSIIPHHVHAFQTHTAKILAVVYTPF